MCASVFVKDLHPYKNLYVRVCVCVPNESLHIKDMFVVLASHCRQSFFNLLLFPLINIQNLVKSITYQGNNETENDQK